MEWVGWVCPVVVGDSGGGGRAAGRRRKPGRAVRNGREAREGIPEFEAPSAKDQTFLLSRWDGGFSSSLGST